MINSKNKIPQGGGRIEYMDLAKGFCIIRVVLFHCDISGSYTQLTLPTN